MAPFEIRPASASDIPRLIVLDHSCMSDYVWQLEVRRDVGQVTANFREVRLPRSIELKYPRTPASLAEEWKGCDVALAAVHDGNPIGYLCGSVDYASGVTWITDLVVSPVHRRKGAASALLTAAQTWASERGLRRLILEMQSKNQAYIRLAQKFGYEFCGYNDQYYPTQDVALFFSQRIR